MRNKEIITDEFPEATAFFFFFLLLESKKTENRRKNGNIVNQQYYFEKGLCECPLHGVLSADMTRDKTSAQGTAQSHETWK